MTEKIFYDHGWNARVKGEEYDQSAKRDWSDGWNDADEAIKDGAEIQEIE